MIEVGHLQVERSLAERILAAPDGRAAASLLIQGGQAIAAFSQAACLLTPFLGSRRVLAASHVADVEQSGPYAIWLRSVARMLLGKGLSGMVPPELLTGAFDPSKFAPGYILFLPFDLRAGEQGAFFFMRSTPWTVEETERLSGLVQAAATRIGYLRRPGWSLFNKRPQWKGTMIAAVAVVILFFPVRMSSIAPAEIVPVEPSLIASGIPGVVRTFHVRSNDPVVAGQVLVTLDDLDQRSKLAIARRDLNVTEAELRRLQQMGFVDPSQRFRLAELEGQLRIRQLEVERAEAELERTVIRADRDGIALCGDALDWQGRPVQIGERIMQVVDPQKTAARLFVPAADGSILSVQTRGRVYLDSDPWNGHEIIVRTWLFEPETTPVGTVAYRSQADWSAAPPPVQIGMRGTAHLDGADTPLVLYLLRRPIILLRQTVSL